MKLISWNCNCAFRNKHHLLPPADILVIAESESPEFLQKHKAFLPYKTHLWVGKRAHKGLSIFASAGWSAEIAEFYNEEFKYIVPVRIASEKAQFLLWAVWTQADGNDSYNGYVVMAARAMLHYRPYLQEDSLIAGDFNSNACWNGHFKQEYNHEQLVRLLSAKGLHSVYHDLSGCEHGAEKEATIFMYKDKNKPYYIDYVFAHEKRLRRQHGFEIGKYGDWIKYSDHMPLFVEFTD
ncbi:MAG: endonuclease/exonuclease/phosphatase family protein [Alphaproteobacteria bacterium]|nr:endonuclease/exonuclease/phosphatase family protein [Alphaproteobacteria bacterium]